ncbi:hypothetical protein SAMN05216389_101407 [Oceanobacillus limi]|uniref:Uncharacterized protein n=1 Tax=Oceanobacillus limi TaxID=930131 RepID=A0A1H9YHS7_9BACI|nr:hypothetical protein SAMN05216389_101407 [Oceanobacillus limi]
MSLIKGMRPKTQYEKYFLYKAIIYHFPNDSLIYPFLLKTLTYDIVKHIIRIKQS